MISNLALSPGRASRPGPTNGNNSPDTCLSYGASLRYDNSQSRDHERRMISVLH
jgi:hypothetical protein